MNEQDVYFVARVSAFGDFATVLVLDGHEYIIAYHETNADNVQLTDFLNALRVGLGYANMKSYIIRIFTRIAINEAPPIEYPEEIECLTQE